LEIITLLRRAGLAHNNGIKYVDSLQCNLQCHQMS
jgi:hypothetical protein